MAKIKKSHMKGMLKLITEATLKFAKANNYIDKLKESTLNKRDKEILAVIKSSTFDGRQKTIARLMGAVTGTDFLPLLGSDSTYMDLDHKFAAIVVLDVQDTLYTKDEVVVIAATKETSGDTYYAKAIRKGNTVGNWLPYQQNKYLRPATAEEISGIPEEQIDALAKYAKIVFV